MQLYRHTQALNKGYAEHRTETAAPAAIEKHVFKGLFALEDDKVIPVEWSERPDAVRGTQQQGAGPLPTGSG